MFVDAELELQYGPGGFTLVAKNPNTGACVLEKNVSKEDYEGVFGEEIVESE